MIKEIYLGFLDNVRDSGKINMIGAAPYLAETFKLSKEESEQVLYYWMSTYTQRIQNKGDE
jgi:hypothetical protein